MYPVRTALVVVVLTAGFVVGLALEAGRDAARLLEHLVEDMA